MARKSTEAALQSDNLKNTKKAQAKPEAKPVVKSEVPKTEEIKPMEKTEEKQKFVVKDVDPNTIVTVRNGFQGKLIYKSKKTGEWFMWDSFGDEQDMELSELKSARSSSKKFFINNWFMFDEHWVVDYLGVSKFYQNAVSIDEFDDIFSKTPEEVEKAIKTMSDGQKESVAYRARQLIAEGGIDSIKVITALETSLKITLIER